MSVSRRCAPFVCLVVGFLLLSGCGPSKYKPSGKIVRNGQPLTISEKGVFVVSFTPADGKKDGSDPIYNATTKQDGTFTIVGPNGQGIPAGKYKAAVQAFDPYPTKDLLANKYNPGNTTLVVEIGSGEVVVDVGK